MSRSGFMGVVEKLRFGDLHPSFVRGLSGGARLFILLWVYFLFCIVLGLPGRFRTL